MTSEKNAPNLTADEMERILSEEDVATLCMSRDNEPYAVPISYAWLDGRMVFHCALTGLKLDYLRANPRVCLVVDRHPDRTRPHQAEGKCTYRFESVVCFGTARILDSPEERLEPLGSLQRYFYARLGLDPEEAAVTPAAAERCGCVVVDVQRMTGRRKGAQEQ